MITCYIYIFTHKKQKLDEELQDQERAFWMQGMLLIISNKIILLSQCQFLIKRKKKKFPHAKSKKIIQDTAKENKEKQKIGELRKKFGQGLGKTMCCVQLLRFNGFHYGWQIFQGIGISRCLGIFDEFNRINIEVLSVIAQQLLQLFGDKAIGKPETEFEGSKIKILPTFSVFITINPGYAGRTELPDNLKALLQTSSYDSRLCYDWRNYVLFLWFQIWQRPLKEDGYNIQIEF